MTNIFLSFLEISLSVSFLIILLLLFGPFLNKRYAAKWKYWIWAVLALRLLIPLSGNGRLYTAAVQSQREMSGTVEADRLPADAPEIGTILRPVVVEMPTQITTPIEMPHEKADSGISVLDIIIFVWLLGSLISIFVHLISYAHYKCQLRIKGRIVKDRDVLCLLLSLKRELHIKCTVRIVEYEKAASPMVIGFLNPILVLPEGQYGMGKKNFQEEGYFREELFFIMKHELIHIKRRDILFKLLLVAAKAVHWFNPLVWIMQKEAEIDMELSCDERVTQGTDYAARKAYTETLMSALHKQRVKRTVLSTDFYGSKRIMKKRFKNILAKTAKKNGVVVLICAAILTVSLGTLVGCAIVGEESENSPLGLEAEEIQIDGLSSEPVGDSSGTVPSDNGTPGETTSQALANKETQTEPSSSNGEIKPPSPSPWEEETQTEPSSSSNEEMQLPFLPPAEVEMDPGGNYLIYNNPVYLEDYYNIPEGKAVIEGDFADLAGEGMSLSFLVVLDEIIVTVQYDDAALLTEGIEETLAQQLDAMNDRFWRWTVTYDEYITWRCILTVRYTDPDGNVLAEQHYSGE